MSAPGSRCDSSSRRGSPGAATNAALLPTTDLIDLRGIPYRKTGAKTADGRGGSERYLQVRNLLLRHGDDVQWGDTGKG